MTLLPAITTESELDAVRKDSELCRRALEAAARASDLAATPELFADGSAIVGATGSTVIKIYAPFDRAHRDVEERVLKYLTDRLSCPTPRVRGTATLDGWWVLHMSRLEGTVLSEDWDQRPQSERVELARQMGEVTAELHALETHALRDLPPDWTSFLECGVERCLDRQQRFELEASWLDRIERYLASVDLGKPELVLLHTELMPAHFLGMSSSGRSRLTGLLDFEPAMLGAPEYELASVGLFVSRGDREIFRSFLAGYGLPASAWNAGLSRRCLAYTLLHRYACLPWYMRFMPMDGVDSLESMAGRWFDC
ncbi:MAG: aminoglycoside phosphotransferase family protein [Planctomycetes bacterium]|nr:aminoglycoside phosphotransferase family protein [Planctomycetota bacterium]